MITKKIKYIFAKILQKMQIPAIKFSFIDPTSRICSKSNILHSTIGRYSYIGNNSTIAYTTIGKFCSIGDNVYIGGASHPVDWISTSPIFHTKSNILDESFSIDEFECYKKTNIGNDVWIGANCNIKGGISIGTGSVIGMGSTVTKNIGEYEIWAGNPAKIIRTRFDSETIDSMLKSNWWNMNDNILKELSKYYADPKKFLIEIERKK